MMIKCTRVEFPEYSGQPNNYRDIFINKYQIKYVQGVDIHGEQLTEINLDRGSIMVTETVEEVLKNIDLALRG